MRLRRIHQFYVFRQAIDRFEAKIGKDREIDESLLADLIYGWGNMGYSAHLSYARAVVQAARETSGPILECGSGLSTLLMGVVAHYQNIEVHSLEHHELWRNRVIGALRKRNLNKVKVYSAPLIDYGGYEWYQIPDDLPEAFQLVICDGPPSTTNGGRYGLLPLMKSNFSPHTTILLDDMTRSDELAIVHRWKEEFSVHWTTEGVQDLYARITMPNEA